MVVINNSHPNALRQRYERVAQEEENVGWGFAALVLLALVVAGTLFWWRDHPARSMNGVEPGYSGGTPDSTVPGNATSPAGGGGVHGSGGSVQAPQ